MGDACLFDMHVHLGWARDAAALAREAETLGVGGFAVTVTPDDYRATLEALGDCPNVAVGVGVHPWWVDDGRVTDADVDRAVELAGTTRYVGEVGLDLSPRHAGSRDAQVSALTRIMEAAAERARRTGERGVVSLHAVRATNDVLDVLQATGALDTCDCIIHWFSGTSDELVRAREAGCHFSVGPLMLESKRGRAWAAQVPSDRLLLETDEPPEDGGDLTATTWHAKLADATERIAELRGASADEIATISEENARRLLRLPQSND